MKDINRFRGCLIGGAVGDALGYPIEFSSYSEIRKRYGENGLTDYVLDNGIARISDDTQMTLFTATGLLHGVTRYSLRGIGAAPSFYVYLSYKSWYRTQTEHYPISEPRFSWLVDLPEMFSRRAPGNTCLTALREKEQGTIEKPINDSKGCGGVMRVAPIGLYLPGTEYYCISQKEIDMQGVQAAASTHGHPLGYIPAAALVHIVSLLSYQNATIPEAVEDMQRSMKDLFKDNPYIGEFDDIIKKAIKLAGKSRDDDYTAISCLGEGWVAEEALAIAVYAALRYHDDFEKAIIASVNHDGDSDSTGSITGNILGAKLGLSGIPERFIEPLELKDIIMEIADDLHHDCQISSYGPDDPMWRAKYSYNMRRPENMEL